MFAAFGQQPLYRNKAFLPSGCVEQEREFCLNYRFLNSFVEGNQNKVSIPAGESETSKQ